MLREDFAKEVLFYMKGLISNDSNYVDSAIHYFTTDSLVSIYANWFLQLLDNPDNYRLRVGFDNYILIRNDEKWMTAIFDGGGSSYNFVLPSLESVLEIVDLVNKKLQEIEDSWSIEEQW